MEPPAGFAGGFLLPEEDDQVCITGQLLHPLSAFVPNVVDLLPERTHTKIISSVLVSDGTGSSRSPPQRVVPAQAGLALLQHLKDVGLPQEGHDLVIVS